MGAGSTLTGLRREGVRFASIVLAVANAARFSLAFLASLVIARAFGTSAETEAFFVARILPLTFLDWAGNILKVGFIPTHARVRVASGAEHARRVSDQIAWIVMGGMLAVTLGAVVGAGGLVWLFAPGFDASARALAVDMLRWMAPFMMAGGMFLVTEMRLNAEQHFSAAARGRVTGRAVVVLAILLLSGPLGHMALPISFIAGVCVQLLTVGRPGVAVWRGVAFRLRPLLPGTRRILAVLLPAFLWMMLDQLKFVVDQNFASRLPEGELAALAYAYQVVQVAVSVSAGAFLTALFPTLSERIATDEDILGHVTRAARRVAWMGGLASVGLIVVAEPLVGLALERGAFTAGDTHRTAGALAYYAPAVLFVSINMLLKILLFLRGRVGPILVVGLTELVLNVILDAVLVGPLGIRGLALATSVTTLVVTIALPLHLTRQGLWNAVEGRGLAWRVLLCTAGTAFLGVFVGSRVGGTDAAARGLELLGVGALSVGVYVTGLRLLGVGFPLRRSRGEAA